MAISDYRTLRPRSSSRRASDRRGTERRCIPYAFGTPEWIEYIKKHYLAWPKLDRRSESRRAKERRRQERRNIRLANSNAQSYSRKSADILSEEERKVLHDMFKDDAVH